MIWEANIMIIPVSVKNQSIDSSGITSDYKAAIVNIFGMVLKLMLKKLV